MSGFHPQAYKHSLTAPTNHLDDHITCSEHFTTIALPEKMAAIIGERALCSAVTQVYGLRARLGWEEEVTYDSSTKQLQQRHQEARNELWMSCG